MLIGKQMKANLQVFTVYYRTADNKSGAFQFYAKSLQHAINIVKRENRSMNIVECWG
jgi:hypothetical protein